ncbi:MAG: LysE family translocator [Muribaculaceae bacterium]|jgi:threonine/homoserine/homoserine lactone efflux protein|nr:LysE family translocator [Muribaculaceae bacterium]
MELILFTIVNCLAVGVFVSAPMGPVGMLCIQRTLNKGRWSGFYTGVGAAFSDLIYCLLTGYGMSFVVDLIEKNQSMLKIVGSVVLLIYGIYLMRKNPAGSLKAPSEKRVTYTQDFVTGFLFTFSNPLILFLIIGLFARFNFPSPDFHYYHYLIGYSFIFIGALAWWFVITLFVNAVRSKFNVRSLWIVNCVIGGVMILLSLVGIVSGFIDFIHG